MRWGKKEKHDDQVQFAVYKQFCDATRGVPLLKQMNRLVFSRRHTEYIATAAKLTKEIAEHEEGISMWNGDERAATQVHVAS